MASPTPSSDRNVGNLKLSSWEKGGGEEEDERNKRTNEYSLFSSNSNYIRKEGRKKGKKRKSVSRRLMEPFVRVSQVLMRDDGTVFLSSCTGKS